MILPKLDPRDLRRRSTTSKHEFLIPRNRNLISGRRAIRSTICNPTSSAWMLRPPLPTLGKSKAVRFGSLGKLWRKVCYNECQHALKSQNSCWFRKFLPCLLIRRRQKALEGFPSSRSPCSESSPWTKPSTALGCLLCSLFYRHARYLEVVS